MSEIKTLSNGNRHLRLPHKDIVFKSTGNLEIQQDHRGGCVEIERADLPDLKRLLGWADEYEDLQEILGDALKAQNFECEDCGVCHCGQSIEGHSLMDNHSPTPMCEGKGAPTHVEQVLRLRREAGFKRAKAKIFSNLKTWAQETRSMDAQAVLLDLANFVQRLEDDGE